jgi:signal transduction histidine kinase
VTAAEATLGPGYRVRTFAGMRVAACGVGAILAALIHLRAPVLQLTALLIVFGCAGLINASWLLLTFLWPLEERPHAVVVALAGAQIIADVATITAVLHFGGGSENPFFPFYVFPVVLSAALLSRRAALVTAGLSALFYGALLATEALGILPHYTVVGAQSPALYQWPLNLWAHFLSLTITCVVASEATSWLVTRLKRRAQALAASNRRAEDRTIHMHELNQQLRTANEECGSARSHLDVLYSELQEAYNRLEVRSQHMSDLNERLRAANAECKLRREELAGVHEQLQEAYRRIETRSEHMKDLNEQLRTANAECKSQRDELTQLNARLATANDKLLELDDARSRFTLLVTHELRAPVAAIQSYLKLILEGYVPEVKVRETLEKAERRALEQLALIADLLELGRIQAADARGHVSPVHLDQALVEQLDFMSARAQERNIQIKTEVGEDLPTVLLNPEQIKSLWNNLISNAIKYNRDDGRVSIRLVQVGERLECEVSDTGIGIPPEAMKHLFSEFFRAENAKAVSRMGTGLGLSIVKETIERAGGQISVESIVDQGTTFRFWLPVIQPQPIPEPVPPEKEEIH